MGTGDGHRGFSTQDYEAIVAPVGRRIGQAFALDINEAEPRGILLPEGRIEPWYDSSRSLIAEEVRFARGSTIFLQDLEQS
jgi:hypothetical protein